LWGIFDVFAASDAAFALGEIRSHQTNLAEILQRSPHHAITHVHIIEEKSAFKEGITFGFLLTPPGVELSATVISNPDNHPILRYIALLTFIPVSYHSNIMIRGILAVLCLGPLRKSSFIQRYFDLLIGEFEGFYESALGFVHPKFGQELFNLPKLVPLKAFFDEFLAVIDLHTPNDFWVLSLINYISRKFKPIGPDFQFAEWMHALTRRIFDQQSSAHNPPIEDLISHDPSPYHAWLRPLFAVRHSFLELKPFDISLSFPIPTPLAVLTAFSTLFPQNIREASGGMSIHLLWPAKLEGLLTHLGNILMARGLITGFHISPPSPHIDYILGNQQVGFHRSPLDAPILPDLQPLDFLVLDAASSLSLREYALGADFLSALIRVVQKKIQALQKALKKSIKAVKKLPLPDPTGHTSAQIMSTTHFSRSISDLFPFRINLSALPTILRNLTFLEDYFTHHATPGEIMQRFSYLTDHQVLYSHYRQNIIDFSLTSSLCWFLRLSLPDDVFSHIRSQFPISIQIQQGIGFLSGLKTTFRRDLFLLLHIPVEEMSLGHYYAFPMNAVPLFDFTAHDWGHYLDLLGLADAPPLLGFHGPRHASSPGTPPNWADLCATGFSPAVVHEAESIPSLPDIRSYWHEHPEIGHPLRAFYLFLWLHYNSDLMDCATLLSHAPPPLQAPLRPVYCSTPRRRLASSEIKVALLLIGQGLYLNPNFVGPPFDELYVHCSDLYYFGGWARNFALLEFIIPRENLSSIQFLLKTAHKTVAFGHYLWIVTHEERFYTEMLMFSPLHHVLTYDHLAFRKTYAPVVSPDAWSRDPYEFLAPAGFLYLVGLLILNADLDRWLPFLHQFELGTVYALESEVKGTLARRDLLVLLPVRHSAPVIQAILKHLDALTPVPTFILTPLWNKMQWTPNPK
jgi:hypothetical protein